MPERSDLARTAPFRPRDVVKYVAIYTGDWRHWRLGSEREREAPPLPPFLALSPGLPNSHPTPPALIVSPSNPCLEWLAGSKKHSGNPCSVCLSDAKSKLLDSSPHLSLPLKFIHRSFLFPSFFYHPFYR